jgi:lysophospholipase L1-like esterase
MNDKGRFLKNLVLVISLVYSSLHGFAQQTVFKDKDVVCFVGNSITFNGGFYHDINLFYATRYPKQKVKFVNCGVGGNMAANVIARLDSDILVHKPTVAVVMLGMNDVNRDLYAIERKDEVGIAEKKRSCLSIV